MRKWSESDWAEWRAERVAIMQIDGHYDNPNILDLVACFEALERLRLRCERRGFTGEEVGTPMPKQMEMPI